MYCDTHFIALVWDQTRTISEVCLYQLLYTNRRHLGEWFQNFPKQLLLGEVIYNKDSWICWPSVSKYDSGLTQKAVSKSMKG